MVLEIKYLQNYRKLAKNKFVKAGCFVDVLLCVWSSATCAGFSVDAAEGSIIQSMQNKSLYFMQRGMQPLCMQHT
jgi:hypothetical protein